MSVQEAKAKFITLEVSHCSTDDKSALGLEQYLSHKPEKLLPLLEGYDVIDGKLIPIKETDFIENKSILIGETDQENITHDING